jgi:hypothetical protein
MSEDDFTDFVKDGGNLRPQRQKRRGDLVSQSMVNLKGSTKLV